jgi:predicted DNA-binding ribbon-helix-helix protein
MNSAVVKRSIVIAGHRTSISLEQAFWTCLKDIARDRHVTLSALVASIDQTRGKGNLSSAIRLFVLDQVRDKSDQPRRSPRAVAAKANSVLRAD